MIQRRLNSASSETVVQVRKYEPRARAVFATFYHGIIEAYKLSVIRLASGWTYPGVQGLRATL
jgi:hypothetical protein